MSDDDTNGRTATEHWPAYQAADPGGVAAPAGDPGVEWGRADNEITAAQPTVASGSGTGEHPAPAAPIWAPPGDPGYPGQQAAGYPGQPGADYPGQPGIPGPPVPPVQAGRSGQPGMGPGRRRTGLLAGVAVFGLLLAAGGGGAIGALIEHHSNSSPVSAADNRSSSSSSAPVVDRSSLASVAAKVLPSVVSIATQNDEGSGVIISDQGYIVTNNHVVSNAQNGAVKVTFSNGNQVAGKVIGADSKTDIAVVKVDNVTGLTPATFGDSDSLQIGDTVLAVGNPLGLNGSVTEGIVSALNRTIDEGSSQQNPFNQQSTSGATIAGAIQTDAAINPGNSGGALVNLNGEVVGINTAIQTNGSSGNIGIGFAIAGNRAKSVAQDLMAGKKVDHPYLGVSVGTADGNTGAQVASVVPNSPAAKAGLKPGDVITKANDTAIHTSEDLVNVTQAAAVGSQLHLTVNRGGQTVTLTVTVGESPN